MIGTELDMLLVRPEMKLMMLCKMGRYLKLGKISSKTGMIWSRMVYRYQYYYGRTVEYSNSSLSKFMMTLM